MLSPTRVPTIHASRHFGPPLSHAQGAVHDNRPFAHNDIELGLHTDERRGHPNAHRSASTRASIFLLTLTAITQILALFFTIAVAHHAFASPAPVRHACIAMCTMGLVSGCWLIVHIVHAKWQRYHPEQSSSINSKRSCGGASVWVGRISILAVLVPTVISATVLCECVSNGVSSHLTLCATWSTGLWATQLLLISYVNVCTARPLPQTRIRPTLSSPLQLSSALAHSSSSPSPGATARSLNHLVPYYPPPSPVRVPLIVPSPPTACYETCSICIEDFQPTEMLFRLPCGHLFHATCASPWLAASQMCPNCKQPVLEDLVSPVICQKRADRRET